jgi:hypothetical protein
MHGTQSPKNGMLHASMGNRVVAVFTVFAALALAQLDSALSCCVLRVHWAVLGAGGC